MRSRCPPWLDQHHTRFGQGQTITCTFTNTKRGTIVIRKVTAPAGDLQSFTITPSYNSGIPFSLTDGQSNTTLNLPLGVYSVVETVPVEVGQNKKRLWEVRVDVPAGDGELGGAFLWPGADGRTDRPTR